jgi:hypothetical protein
MALSKIDVSKMITGVTPLVNGGTGATSIPATNLASSVTGTLPAANGGTGVTTYTPGKVVQVVSVNNSSNDGSSSSTYTDLSLSLAITPTSSSNKILVFMSVNSHYMGDSDTNIDLALKRTGGASGDGNILEFEGTSGFDGDLAGHGGSSSSCTHLDSPAVSSAVTYGGQFRSSNNSNPVYVNHWVRGDVRPRSTLTLMEIAT